MDVSRSSIAVATALRCCRTMNCPSLTRRPRRVDDSGTDRIRAATSCQLTGHRRRGATQTREEGVRALVFCDSDQSRRDQKLSGALERWRVEENGCRDPQPTLSNRGAGVGPNPGRQSNQCGSQSAASSDAGGRQRDIGIRDMVAKSGNAPLPKPEQASEPRARSPSRTLRRTLPFSR